MKGRTPLLALGAFLALGACSLSEGTYPGQCVEGLKSWRNSAESDHALIWNLIRLQNAGTLSWNGQPVSDETIVRYLTRVSEMDPRPRISLAIEPGTACSRVREVRALMQEAPICSRDRSCVEDSDWENPGGRQI